MSSVQAPDGHWARMFHWKRTAEYRRGCDPVEASVQGEDEEFGALSEHDMAHFRGGQCIGRGG
jgi:hypothetical protein